MVNVSVTAAWNETAAFVKREARLLFPLAFMLIALPVAILQALVPAASEGEMPPPGAWLALIPLVMIATGIGNIAIAYLAVRPNRSVRDAIGRGARRLLPLLGALLLLVLVLTAAVFVASTVAALVVPGATQGAATGQPTPALGMAMLIVALLLLPLLLFVAGRLMLMTPVAAAEDGGPIAIIRRSWALSAGYFWKLLGALVLMMIAMWVVMLAVEAVFGSLIILLAGQPRPGNTSAFLIILVRAALNTVIAVYFYTMIARIYAQFVPSAPSTSGT